MVATHKTFHLDRRSALGGLLLFAPATGWSGCTPTRVLFVCEAGTVKSAVAREALKLRARERGVPVVAVARGLAPEDHATPAFLAAADADHLNPRAEPVRKLSRQDVAAADLVVSFEPTAGLGIPGARDWSDTPSFLKRYPAAHALLMARIDRLLDEIASRPCR